MFEAPELAIAPGPELAAVLAAVRVDGAPGSELIDVMTACERLASWVSSVQMTAMAEFARTRTPTGINSGQALEDFAEDEVATALTISRLTAANRVTLAHHLQTRLPSTLEAVRAGELTPYKAKLISEGICNLDQALVPAVEAKILTAAQGQTPAQLRASVDRAVFAADPAAIRKRHAAARKGRRIVKNAEPDGMATLWAIMPADDATTIYNGLTAIAEFTTTPGDIRGIDARRVDTLVDLVRDALDPHRWARRTTPATPGTAAANATKPLVHVTVAANTLAGIDDLPGELAGHGPIPASLARLIAADADWRRILTDPATGAVLDVGATRYRPPAGLRRHVMTRDKTCRFPGCRRVATRCDLDHTVPFPAGPTAAHNLHALCRHHHRLKHESRWHLRRKPADDDNNEPAALIWSSPTGHVYYTHAPPVLAHA